MPSPIAAVTTPTAAATSGSRAATTPEAAAKLFSTTGDVAGLGAFLNETPAQNRSSAAVKLVQAMTTDAAGLKKLATDGFTPVVTALSTQPHDPGVTGAISTLMAARPGAAPAAKPATPEPAQPGARPWLPGNDGMRRSYGPGQDLPLGKAQAVNKEGYVDPMVTSGRTTKAVTRGWGSDRTVGVKCAFEVGVTNPKTGKPETVLFKGVEDHRSAGWGFGNYNTAADINSEVLVCSGQNYEKGRPNPNDPINYMSGSMTSVSALDYRSIPDLKRRVEIYLKTGDTGNDKVK